MPATNSATSPAVPRRPGVRHSPSGRAVPARAVTAFHPQNLDGLWPGTEVHLLESGSAALALAIRHALRDAPAGAPKRVALPAYGCSSLVAAAAWAGAEPVYYDLTAELAPEQNALTEFFADEACAIVQVDMFGVDAGSNDHPRLIRDLAQSFAPYEPGWRPTAPYTILSTGRAKPLSLVVGGALLTTTTAADAGSAPELAISRGNWVIRAGLYGLSQRPAVLGVLSSVFRLGLGSTEFTALDEVHRMPDGWAGVFGAAVEAAREMFDDWRAETHTMVRLALDSGARIPHSARSQANRMPLWRIPVLCPSTQAASALATEGWHLGVSRLYGRTLPVIMGQSPDVAAQRWPGATEIADRLVTLPTHGRLNARRRGELGALLCRYSSPTHQDECLVPYHGGSDDH